MMPRNDFCGGAFGRMLLVTVLLTAAASRGEISPQVALPNFPATVLSLTNFGAIGDGKFFNTAAFDQALATLAENGGGKLEVPPGLWLTGPIRLRSHINLHLQPGALIQFSGDFKLYPLTVINLKGEREVDSTSPISGQDLEDVAITGAGIIDGGGDAWRPMKKGKLSEGDWKNLVKSGGVLNAKGDSWWPSRAAMDGEKLVGQLRQSSLLNLADYEPAHPFLRPKMVRLIQCKNFLLDGVTFQNPPNWTLNPVLCEDVSILNVNVRNLPTAQNSDALDVESCRRVEVRACTFDVGDDGICLKSGKATAGRRIGVPTEDVLIEDCVVYHAHGGFTIGSEMSGGVRNVRVNNCVFIGTDVGLRFKSTRGRGGVVENIFINNVRMKDISGDAINFNLYYGGKSALDDEHGLAETNVVAANEETPQFRDIHIENVICRGADKAVVLQGLPEMPVRHIHLRNVSITARAGVFLMDAAEITLENTEIINGSGPVLNFSRTKNSRVDKLHYAAGATAVAAVKGSGTSGIVIENTDFTAARTNFISDEIPVARVFEVK
jgi:polygalacturonase